MRTHVMCGHLMLRVRTRCPGRPSARSGPVRRWLAAKIHRPPDAAVVTSSFGGGTGGHDQEVKRGGHAAYSWRGQANGAHFFAGDTSFEADPSSTPSRAAASVRARVSSSVA